jgi:hypothetical protein
VSKPATCPSAPTQASIGAFTSDGATEHVVVTVQSDAPATVTGGSIVLTQNPQGASVKTTLTFAAAGPGGSATLSGTTATSAKFGSFSDLHLTGAWDGLPACPPWKLDEVKIGII